MKARYPDERRDALAEGRTALGIELGSTRIKAVLVDDHGAPVATATSSWENHLVDGVWSYEMSDAWHGIQQCVAGVLATVRTEYGLELNRLGSMGVSGMMHGYLPFDSAGNQLVPFRTWRNTNTGSAVSELSALLGVNIPHRWSVAHLYQAVMDGEEHVSRVDFLTTLSGYVHWRLTGERILGIGDSSGMFPIDDATRDYDERLLSIFEERLEERGVPLRLRDVLPRVGLAGQPAGSLTAEGAALLDPSGTIQPGVPLCSPEGDAGTGMVATNAVAPRTGNISAGTSLFAMAVLEHPLSAPHRELDMVTTPAGDVVAMVHCNNGTSDIDEWVGLFSEFAKAAGVDVPPDDLYGILYRSALEAPGDAGGIVTYNYVAGEPITDTTAGRPLLMRLPDAPLHLAPLMRAHLMSIMSTLRLGMEILFEEGVEIDCWVGHGGLFRTPSVGQRLMAAALEAPVAVGTNAGEGGPWGMALLALYGVAGRGRRLADFLDEVVFVGGAFESVYPVAEDVAGFRCFLERYRRGLLVERAAVEALPD
ncbi:xylulokinase [Cutibacterium sp. V947]|uniref:xylulokinase n=1 Tax=unclassified Cutibacterium TaxID=2649671 RepID=UPI003EDE931F